MHLVDFSYKRFLNSDSKFEYKTQRLCEIADVSLDPVKNMNLNGHLMEKEKYADCEKRT